MPRSESLNANKWRALVAIDEAASQARRAHLTPGFGQDLVYMTKLAQAQSYLSLHALSPLSAVPAYIAAEAAAWGVSPEAAAQAVLAAAGGFHLELGPAIEQARMEGKIAVRAAQTIDDVSAALSAATGALSKFS